MNVLDRFGTPGPPIDHRWAGAPEKPEAAGGRRTVLIAEWDRLTCVDSATSATRWQKPMTARSYVAFDGTNYVVASPEYSALRVRWIDEDGNVLRESAIAASFRDSTSVAVSARDGAVLFAWNSRHYTIDGVLVRDGRAMSLLDLVRDVAPRILFNPSLAVALRDDDALVVWTERPRDGTMELFGVRVSVDGTRAGLGERAQRVRIATDTTLGVVVAATDGTRDRIAWQPGEPYYVSKITFADLDDELRVTSSVVVTDISPYAYRPVMAASDGTIAAAWRAARGILRGRVLDPSEPVTALAEPASLARTLSGDIAADVTWTGDRYFVAWVRTVEPEELVVREFSADGAPLTEPRVVARATSIAGVRVAASRGAVLVTWMVAPEEPALLHAARVDVGSGSFEELVIPSPGPVTGTAMTAGGVNDFLAVWRTGGGLFKSVIPAMGPVAAGDPILVIEHGKRSSICDYAPVAANGRYQLTFTDCAPTQYQSYTRTPYLARLTANYGFARRLPIDEVDAIASSGDVTMLFRGTYYSRDAVASDPELHFRVAGTADAKTLGRSGDAAFTGTMFLFASDRDYTWFDRDGRPLGKPVELLSPLERGTTPAVAGDGRDAAMLIYRPELERTSRARIVRPAAE